MRKTPAQIIHELYSRGIHGEKVVGFHGTSIEAVKNAIRVRAFSGCPYLVSSGSEKIRPGDLFFCPIEGAFPLGDHELMNFECRSGALSYAQGYAETAGMTHYIIKTLGLDFGDEDHQKLALRFIYDHYKVPFEGIIEDWEGGGIDLENLMVRIKEIDKKNELENSIRFLVRRGVRVDQLMSTIKIAYTRRGVVIALDKAIVGDFESTGGDSDEGDELRINCPDGLEFSYIAGIEPMGGHERDFLEELA